MSEKVETYSIPIHITNVTELITELNRIFSLIEDRLDDIEAVRGSQYGRTARWEKDIVEGE